MDLTACWLLAWCYGVHCLMVGYPVHDGLLEYGEQNQVNRLDVTICLYS
jgi:hypothetical protein